MVAFLVMLIDTELQCLKIEIYPIWLHKAINILVAVVSRYAVTKKYGCVVFSAVKNSKNRSLANKSLIFEGVIEGKLVNR